MHLAMPPSYWHSLGLGSFLILAVVLTLILVNRLEVALTPYVLLYLF